MTSEPPPDDPDDKAAYDVGYGKPPQATRFQPGRSGNPKGRPKGTRKKPPVDAVMEQWKALVLKEAYRPIQVRDGDTMVEMTPAQAVLRGVSLRAMKGDPRSAAMFFSVVGAADSERRRDYLKSFETAVVYKLENEKRFDEARLRGLPEPEQLPHPDHLIIDPIAGSVEVRGPMTREEKKDWDEVIAMKASFEEQLSNLLAEQRVALDQRDHDSRIANFRAVVARCEAKLASFHRILAG